MRRLLAVVLLAFLVSACGGTADPGPRPKNVPVRDVKLPELDPATPAFAVASDTPLSPDEISSTRSMAGVEVVARAAADKMKVRGNGTSATLTVAAVDSLDLRAIAPGPTRDADFVWTSLLAGNAVVTFDAGKTLKLDLSEPETVGTKRGPLTVGAMADTAVPNFAHVLVDAAYGRRFGLTDTRLLLVGAEEDANIGSLGDRLQERFPNAEVRRLLPTDLVSPGDPESGGAAYGGVIGYMRFKTLEDGFIEPDPRWVATNIATGDVPIIGTVTCHRLIFPQLGAALAEIEAAGLAAEIDPGDYGGCYVPRFISRDPTRALSMHAFGLAIDLNVSTNMLGTEGDMHPDVVEIFKKWGFEWGGDWQSPKDPMHFEVVRLVNP